MRHSSLTVLSSVLTVSASFVAASNASASVIFFDDAAAYTQTFESYSGAAASFSGGSGNNAWTATSPNGVFGQTGVIRTLAASDTLSFNFASNNVYSVGGLFHYVNETGGFQSGVMKIRLSNGDEFVRTVDAATTFTGFLSEDFSISSLQLSRLSTVTGSTFAAAETMTIGYVPAPGAAALVALAGIVSSRRRRNCCQVEVCFMNHLAATHAKVVASYKPLAHARQGLVIFGHYLIWRGKTVYDLIVHDKSRPFATANQSSACTFGLVASHKKM